MSSSAEGMTSYSTFFHFFSEPLMAAAMTCVVVWGVRRTQTNPALGPAKMPLAFLILWITEFWSSVGAQYSFCPHDHPATRVLYPRPWCLYRIVILLSTAKTWNWPEQ